MSVRELKASEMTARLFDIIPVVILIAKRKVLQMTKMIVA